jgi:hypothetical protein
MTTFRSIKAKAAHTRHRYGGVLYPTHGVRIPQAIKAFLKRNHIALACLVEPDFRNIVLLTSGERISAYGCAARTMGCVLLNATLLKELDRDMQNFVMLHEICHMCTGEEEEATRLAIELGRKLGLKL